MNVFDTAAVLVAIAAVTGYVNYRLLKLPATSGTLVVALATSFAVLAVNAVYPDLQLQKVLAALLEQIDFNQALMHGMLCFLLFAGALGVDLHDIMAQKGTITALATAGVLLSTASVGLLAWGVFGLIGIETPLEICLVFGALISPTDPIAVMGLLKELHAPKELAAQIAGESLFNDGIGVVVFLALVSVAGLDSGGSTHQLTADAGGIVLFLVQQVAGGCALGLGLGYAGYRALKSIDHHPLELLITLALVMFTYTLSFWIHVSGPIAVVVAGLLIGNPGRRLAMSENTRAHVDGFWEMTDEILNAVLFLLLGLQMLAVPFSSATIVAAILAIPITLSARLVSVAVPVFIRRWRGHATMRGLTGILTWTGLRGGISVAMMLSLPHFPMRELLLACTYAVVVFSILVQGLTVRRLLRRYGLSAGR